MVFIATLMALTYKYGNLGNVLLYAALSNKEPSQLTTEQKIFLFHENIERKKLHKALLIGSEFHSEINELSKADRVYIAGHLGIALREHGGRMQELELYDDFFKKDFPALHHAFRASAFRSSNDLEMANTEFNLAKKAAEETGDLLTGAILAKRAGREG